MVFNTGRKKLASSYGFESAAYHADPAVRDLQSGLGPFLRVALQGAGTKPYHVQCGNQCLRERPAVFLLVQHASWSLPCTS